VETGEVGCRRKVNLGIICILTGCDVPTQHVHPKALGLEEGQEGLGNEKVELGGKRATLSNPCCVRELGGEVAVDEGTCPSVGEEELHPREEPGPETEGLQDTKKELPDDSVIGLVEVQEHSDGLTCRRECCWKELVEHDVLPDVTTGQKACLLWLNEAPLNDPEPGGQDLSEHPVVGVEKGDGPVVARLGTGTSLVEGDHEAIKEAGRELPQASHG
jgi:hypothetical protein